MNITKLKVFRTTAVSVTVVSALGAAIDVAISSSFLAFQAGLVVGGFILFLITTLRIEKLERDNG